MYSRTGGCHHVQEGRRVSSCTVGQEGIIVCSGFKNALGELEQLARKWAWLLTKLQNSQWHLPCQAVAFALPAATAATIQVVPNSITWQSGLKYMGSIVQAVGGQDKELQRRLCSAGQAFRSLKATPGGWGFRSLQATSGGQAIRSLQL